MEISGPRRCIIGTVGLPGDRTFYWQIADDSTTYSIRIEKQQASVIAEQIDSLLDDLSDDFDIPPRKMSPTLDKDPLELPIESQFELVSLGVYLVDRQVQLDLRLVNSDNDTLDLRVFLTPVEAREFCARSNVVVAAGRSICPFCQLPIEPDGHICVRANGYRR